MVVQSFTKGESAELLTSFVKQSSIQPLFHSFTPSVSSSAGLINQFARVLEVLHPDVSLEDELKCEAVTSADRVGNT